MRSLGTRRGRNVLNTKEKQSEFTHWKTKFRQARPLKRVRSLSHTDAVPIKPEIENKLTAGV
jgi:hypothetical protein